MLWFRNLIPYRIKNDVNLSEERLLEALEQRPFTPCAPSSSESVGFISPAQNLVEERVFSRMGAHLICLCSEEKILPASVVNEAVNTRIAELESAQARKVFKKEKQQLKDELRADLLLKAFTRKRQIRALILPASGWILIDTPTPARAELLLNELRAALGSLPIERFTADQSPTELMSRWVEDESALRGNFTLGGDAELFDPLEEQSQIKVRNQNLAQPEIHAHIQQGMRVSQLSLDWSEQIQFKLTRDLCLKQLKPLDQFAESDSDDALEALDAEFTQLSLTLDRLLQELDALFNPVESQNV